VFINPEDPVSLPKGFIAWDDGVLVKENGTQLWVKKTGILAILDSPESALIVVTSNAKLEKNGQGFVFDVPRQDPNFVEELNEIVRIVGKETSRLCKM
jgi:hypothetical protein